MIFNKKNEASSNNSKNNKDQITTLVGEGASFEGKITTSSARTTLALDYVAAVVVVEWPDDGEPIAGRDAPENTICVRHGMIEAVLDRIKRRLRGRVVE